MATLILGVAGAGLGSVFGGIGAIVGRAAGALAGYAIDSTLFGGSTSATGPRLSDLDVQASTEGAVLPRVYGKARVAGQMIWATDFEEATTTESQGGKGGPTITTTEFSYFANFALALCEGEISQVGRIWADGKPLDKSRYTIRVYTGSDTQEADSLILAKQGDDAPAYRGTAYAVFERLPIGEFGNRIPQLSFEVFRPLGEFEACVRAVCVIPGSTEFGYDTEVVTRVLGPGTYEAENAHALSAASDWTVSIDELQAICPNLEWATLVVVWFGDDLRVGSCTIRPKVDDPAKETLGADWYVSGVDRSSAEQVSLVDGRPAYGGTPSDLSIVRAIADLKARGLKVVLAPFVMMDVPAENSLPDPYSGGSGQPAYPWRGRITCHPAPEQPGSPDRSAAIAADVAAFMGTAEPADFADDESGIAYAGPAEWSYRRMALHYAHLGAKAGGVDAFLIGSELRGLTTLRSDASSYPFVGALKALAADVRAIVGAAPALSYAADWSEYFGHQPADGSGDVHFHLDPLWADANIDFIGIDVYHPLADWRDGSDHLDAIAGRSPYNPDYLLANVRGGEGFDWFYASGADRDAQARTPITDGAAGKPWAFRYKDIEAWWANEHYDRPGGVEAATPTEWAPRGKPIWFTELGCPAIDKGANQPNVFFDPKSSESFFPHYSGGWRDDLAQRSYIEAFQRFFDADHPEFAGSNPVSPVYGGPMVDPAHLHLWAWDARPYPYFPECTDVWSDGANWERGHWLNGRLGAITLADLIDAIMADHGFADYAVEDTYGTVTGYLVNETLSARAALEPILGAFRTDAADAGDRVLFRGRSRPIDATVEAETLVERPEEPLTTKARAQETELASELVLRAIDPGSDYRIAAATSRRLAGHSRRSVSLDLTAVLGFAEAERLADMALRDIWTGRETLELRLPASALALDAGDLVALDSEADAGPWLIERVEDGADRSVALRRTDSEGPAPPLRPTRARPPEPTPAWGPPAILALEYAPPDGADAAQPRLAAFADPWPGTMAVHLGAEGGGFRLARTLTRPAAMGRLLAPLPPGPVGTFDRGNAIEVRLHGRSLAGLPEIDVLAGGNGAAVRTSTGAWEVLQFAEAELIAEDTYRLSKLLRGQCGTEQAGAAGAETGADFVLLDAAVAALPIPGGALGTPVRCRVGPAHDSHAAASFAEIVVTPAGIGLKPFAPVHLRARRDVASGSIDLTWIRRTRFGGDGWELAEAPLNEAREAYRVEVRSGADLIRQAESPVPAWRYEASDQVADFAGPASGFVFRVAQLSAPIGPGYWLQETVNG